MVLQTFFKPAPGDGMSSLVVLEPMKFVFLSPGQKPIFPFEGPQIILFRIFKFYFWRLFFEVIGNLKLCRACAAKVAFLGIGLIKIYLIGSIVPAFENRKSLHPTV